MTGQTSKKNKKKKCCPIQQPELLYIIPLCFPNFVLNIQQNLNLQKFESESKSEKESEILFKIRISVLITGARLLFYFFGVRTRGITRHVIHIGQLEMFSTLAVRLTKGAISKSNSMCLLSEFCLLAFDAFPEKLLFLCFWLLYLKLCQHLLTTREGLQEQ